MPLDNKSKQVLIIIMKSHSYISINELSNRLDISRRSIYYNISKINSWLEDNDQNKIVNIYTKGLFIDDITRAFVSEYFLKKERPSTYFYSKDERMAIIYLLLTCVEGFDFSISTVAEYMGISKSTLFNDLNWLKEKLEKDDIQIDYSKHDGYKIFGDEKDIRNTLYYYASEIEKKGKLDYEFLSKDIVLENQNIGAIIDGSEKKLVQKMINDIEGMLDISFSDNTIKNLINRIILSIKRIRSGCLINPNTIDIKEARETREHIVSIMLSRRIKDQLGVALSFDEIGYLTILILSSKIKKYNHSSLQEAQTKKLYQIIGNMIHDFEMLSCIKFNDKDTLKENLFVHLMPAYHRVKNEIVVDNHLLDRIKQNYKEIFDITETVSKPFAQFAEGELHEAEIAYIAIHFGAWVQRSQQDINMKKTIVLVCPAGLGVSRIVENQLGTLLPKKTFSIVVMSQREYETADTVKGDLVISTIMLEEKNMPVYIINSILSLEEKQKLMKYITRLFSIEGSIPRVDTIVDIVSKYADIRDKKKLIDELTEYAMQSNIYYKEVNPMLNKLITKDRIQIVDKVESWEKAIEVAARPLVKSGCVEERYISAMIESVNDLGPYIVIAPDIAIPHARPELGVIKTSMSILKLTEPVYFSKSENHRAKLLFVLASKDNNEHLTAIRQLNRMLIDNDNMETLKGNISQDEIMDLIDKYSE